jgi:hypothetical protein
MKYTMKAHPTMYAGVQFRSRLEARWAAFFDLAKWGWEYEPLDLEGWTPDFRITVPLRTEEGEMFMKLLVEVKPYDSVEQFTDHAMTKYNDYLDRQAHGGVLRAVGLGNSPEVCTECLLPDIDGHWDDRKLTYSTVALPTILPFRSRGDDIHNRWAEAGNRVMYLKPSPFAPGSFTRRPAWGPFAYKGGAR